MKIKELRPTSYLRALNLYLNLGNYTLLDFMRKNAVVLSKKEILKALKIDSYLKGYRLTFRGRRGLVDNIFVDDFDGEINSAVTSRLNFFWLFHVRDFLIHNLSFLISFSIILFLLKIGNIQSALTRFLVFSVPTVNWILMELIRIHRSGQLVCAARIQLIWLTFVIAAILQNLP